MPSNTPMTAAELLALADQMAATHTASPDFFEARDAYKAARAASPVTLMTLEEWLMAEEVRTKNELAHRMLHFGAFTYEDRIEAERAHIEASRLRVEHARRLAGEGGTK